MFKKIALPLTLILLSACGSRSNLPSSVSYNSMSAGSSRSTTTVQAASTSRASTTPAQSSDLDSAGSRLSARQSGMQDSGGISYGNAERTASREAQIDNGSMVDASASNNPDTRSKPAPAVAAATTKTCSATVPAAPTSKGHPSYLAIKGR
jgi:hypothetical protein